MFDMEDTGEVDADRLQQLLAEDGEEGHGFRNKEIDGASSMWSYAYRTHTRIRTAGAHWHCFDLVWAQHS